MESRESPVPKKRKSVTFADEDGQPLEQVQLIKKKRGRPRKSEGEITQPLEQVDQPKEKRGRPRKSEGEQPQQSAEESGEEVGQPLEQVEKPKKKRGRPRKSGGEQPQQSAEESGEEITQPLEQVEKPKKKRGRPRKSGGEQSQQAAEDAAAAAEVVALRLSADEAARLRQLPEKCFSLESIEERWRTEELSIAVPLSSRPVSHTSIKENPSDGEKTPSSLSLENITEESSIVPPLSSSLVNQTPINENPSDAEKTPPFQDMDSRESSVQKKLKKGAKMAEEPPEELNEEIEEEKEEEEMEKEEEEKEEKAGEEEMEEEEEEEEKGGEEVEEEEKEMEEEEKEEEKNEEEEMEEVEKQEEEKEEEEKKYMESGESSVQKMRKSVTFADKPPIVIPLPSPLDYQESIDENPSDGEKTPPSLFADALRPVSTPSNDGDLSMENNLPEIEKVMLAKYDESSLRISIFINPSNLPFFVLNTFDEGQFDLDGSSNESCLRLNLTGLEDPLVKQVSSLLSGHVKNVDISYNVVRLSLEDIAVITQLLQDSTIGVLDFSPSGLDDSTAFGIIDTISRAKSFELWMDDELELSNPAAFITQLDALPLTSVYLYHMSSSFFGLPNSFWEEFINTKLSSGSMEYARARGKFGRIKKAPIDLGDGPIGYLEWNKVKAE